MNGLGRTLIIIGAVFLISGVVIMFAGKFNLPLGHLPGDIILRKKNMTVYFPWVTTLLISVVLSLIMNFISRWKN
ncbi:MAG: DUF2905 domain-containing protein [Synergistaceae bacterium]|nr:DUF2905 domain-containing protein [Synergistaceae bacterium]